MRDASISSGFLGAGFFCSLGFYEFFDGRAITLSYFWTPFFFLWEIPFFQGVMRVTRLVNKILMV